MLRDPDRDYENVATAGPVVQQQGDGTYRMWYSAIGTRWGYYAIGYAESEDGLHWRRGQGYGDNLQLGPVGSGWERQMVEYPSVAHDGRRTRLFYCGNGYGTSGIGTAVAAPLRATPEQGAPAVRLVASETTYGGVLRFPAALSAGGESLVGGETLAGGETPVRWHGPDAEGPTGTSGRTRQGSPACSIGRWSRTRKLDCSCASP